MPFVIVIVRQTFLDLPIELEEAILCLLAQRYIVRGLTLGAVKG